MQHTFRFPSAGSFPSGGGRSFPPQPASAPAARQYVMSMGLSDDEGLNQRLATLVSELATNAILHARTVFQVYVSTTGDSIRVAVSDGSDAIPVKRNYDETQPTGRGLHFVEALSDRWGYSSRSTGKTVWFELDPART